MKGDWYNFGACNGTNDSPKRCYIELRLRSQIHSQRKWARSRKTHTGPTLYPTNTIPTYSSRSAVSSFLSNSTPNLVMGSFCASFTLARNFSAASGSSANKWSATMR